MSELLQRLKQAIAETSITAVANKIGVSRSALSLVISGKYGVKPSMPHGASIKNVLEKFERAYSGVNCPYAGRELTRDECFNRSTGPRPFGGASKTAWWDACQSCNHKHRG